MSHGRSAMPRFQPFTKMANPFAIGLAPLNDGAMLWRDEEHDRFIAEKRALYAADLSAVFSEEEDTRSAQQEAADLIAAAGGGSITPADAHLPPLAASALTVQDDLVLMRRDESGWRFVAGSVCFPSSWSLAEKFGKPLEAIHRPVPYIAGKMGDRIRRIFDALRPEQPLWRENWSLSGDANLRHDKLEKDHTPTHKKDILAGPLWLRCEYQTLHKLPVSGDILFTIRILVKPMDDIAGAPNGPAMLRALAEQYDAIGEAGRAYKGMAEGAEPLLEWINRRAARS